MIELAKYKAEGDARIAAVEQSLESLQAMQIDSGGAGRADLLTVVDHAGAGHDDPCEHAARADLLQEAVRLDPLRQPSQVADSRLDSPHRRGWGIRDHTAHSGDAVRAASCTFDLSRMLSKLFFRRLPQIALAKS